MFESKKIKIYVESEKDHKKEIIFIPGKCTKKNECEDISDLIFCAKDLGSIFHIKKCYNNGPKEVNIEPHKMVMK
jgi:hypothetical protein